MDPPAFLVDGDEVRVEVGDLGAIVNPVVDEVAAEPVGTPAASAGSLPS
jgi:hypothetical protein